MEDIRQREIKLGPHRWIFRSTLRGIKNYAVYDNFESSMFYYLSFFFKFNIAGSCDAHGNCQPFWGNRQNKNIKATTTSLRRSAENLNKKNTFSFNNLISFFTNFCKQILFQGKNYTLRKIK